MGFFDDVKEFFQGKPEKAEAGMGETAERAGDGAAARAEMGDVDTYVSNDIEVVRAKRDLQTAEQQLATATQRRDSKKKELQSELAKAKQQSYHQQQRAAARGQEMPNPHADKVADLESKLSIFQFNQWSEDVKSAKKSVKRMKQKVADATSSARNRHRSAVSGR